MIKDTSKNDNNGINPIIKRNLTEFIMGYLEVNQHAKIGDLIEKYDGDFSVLKSEFIYVIKEGVNDGLFRYVSKNNDIGEYVIEMRSHLPSRSNKSRVRMVVSTPHLIEISVNEMIKRNEMINLKECFEYVFQSAEQDIRICSPFMQDDILREEAFPQIKLLIKSAFERGVLVRIITREIDQKKSGDIKWIIDLAESVGAQELLKITDYHITRDYRVYASTHAKLIVADKHLAYIGSGELRKNSLNVNLEIGCLVEGDIVAGLCEIFDYMFEKGDEYG